MRIAIGIIALGFAMGCNSVSAQSETTEDLDDVATSSRSFAVSDFDRVELQGPDDAEVRIGDQFAVRAEGSPAILETLEIEVEEGRLEIGRQDDIDYRDPRYRGSARIFVTMPVVRGAAVAGSGDMTVEAGEGEEFSAAIAGSGDLAIGTVTATTGSFAISGSGDLSAAGTARDLETAIAGSGSMELADLRAETMRAAIQGSGEIDAYVTGRVEASFAGSGEVQARGGASCQSTSIGSGRLVCSD